MRLLLRACKLAEAVQPSFNELLQECRARFEATAKSELTPSIEKDPACQRQLAELRELLEENPGMCLFYMYAAFKGGLLRRRVLFEVSFQETQVCANCGTPSWYLLLFTWTRSKATACNTELAGIALSL